MQARIWNDNGWLAQTQPGKLRRKFDAALRRAGFKVLGVLEHRFKPHGYTVLYLLAESHFALHTFPECGRTYYEISSCNKPYYLRLLETIDGERMA